MEIIIYGKSNCIHCEKTRMLCQIRSLPFRYHTVGSDISIDSVQAKVGQPVQSLPQIFIHQAGKETYVGGYDALRQTLLALPA